jgi:hypothetical protein
MKLHTAIIGKLGGIAAAVARFPATLVMLATAAGVISVAIEKSTDPGVRILALIFAAFCFLIAQTLTERFAKTNLTKIIFYIIAALSAGLYYFIVRNGEGIDTVTGVNSASLIFALAIAFIWIPSIKGGADFNAVFMSVFKAVFTSVFYSAVIWGGIALIIAAVDLLLVRLNGNIYSHTAVFILVVWAPMLMLSLVPVFGRGADAEKVKKASDCPKFLEIALSYILIPLAVVYTLVLLLYIIKTIAGGGWDDNLLEGLMISYCISVLLIYILSSRLGNRFALLFRRSFPLLLAAVALFQLVSTSVTVFTDGIVHERYYVLLFGVYSVLCGILLFALPVTKNGVVALFAVCFAIVSVLPAAGAFPVSASSQRAILRDTLAASGMLDGNTLIPRDDISDRDKSRIYDSVIYLTRIDRTDKLGFLPGDFDAYADFERTFGFMPGFYPGETSYRWYTIDMSQPLEIGGYDYIKSVNLHMPGNYIEEMRELKLTVKDMTASLSLGDLITVPLDEIFDELLLSESGDGKGIISAERMTFDFENESAAIRVIITDASISRSPDENINANLYVLYSAAG